MRCSRFPQTQLLKSSVPSENVIGGIAFQIKGAIMFSETVGITIKQCSCGGTIRKVQTCTEIIGGGIALLMAGHSVKQRCHIPQLAWFPHVKEPFGRLQVLQNAPKMGGGEHLTWYACGDLAKQ